MDPAPAALPVCQVLLAVEAVDFRRDTICIDMPKLIKTQLSIVYM